MVRRRLCCLWDEDDKDEEEEPMEVPSKDRCKALRLIIRGIKLLAPPEPCEMAQPASEQRPRHKEDGFALLSDSTK